MKRLANIVGALCVAGCATGPGNVVVSMQPYASPAAANAAAPKTTVRVDAVKDARPEAVGGFVGERKGLGGMSMGSIEVQPRPAELVGQLLVAELKQMGYQVAASNPQLTVATQLLKFEVATPATAVYWDVNGTVEIALMATAENGKKHDARYGATCTDRTYVWPSEEIIGKVVAACMSAIGAKVRDDTALASLGGR
jgi:uncharacterized lipoprotein YajG